MLLTKQHGRQQEERAKTFHRGIGRLYDPADPGLPNATGIPDAISGARHPAVGRGACPARDLLVPQTKSVKAQGTQRRALPQPPTPDPRHQNNPTHRVNQPAPTLVYTGEWDR